MNNSKTLQEEIRKLAKIELSSRHLIDFTKYTYPQYQFTWFHEAYTNKVNDFAEGRIKKLMVFVPPQHGKSEISTRRLPAYLLGKNPNSNIAVVTYNDTKAKKFNREIKRIINDGTYKDIFPNIELPKMMGGYTNSANEFEIVGYKGNCKAIGVGGALTGDPVDMLIMDDLYKDAMSAWSSTIRQNVEDWYDTVADTRLHNDSQQLIVFTRWHHLDLAGKLLKEEATDWEVVIFEAIKDNIDNAIDIRSKGEALWPEKHSVEKLIKSRNRNPHVFRALFQQQPKPIEGLLYSEFKTYDINKTPSGQILNYTDTADTGSDYLCSISYIKQGSLYYILDVYYTQARNEITEQELSELLMSNGTNVARIESNAGGRAFARNIERISKELGNRKLRVTWFHQSKNKDARINSNSSTVNNCVVFPSDWAIRWPELYDHVTNYMAEGKNKHDDSVDVLTGIVEGVKDATAPIVYI